MLAFAGDTSLTALVVIAAMAILTWLVSLAKGDASIVDSVWSLLIWAAGAVYVYAAGDPGPRGWLMFGLLSVWALRLCVYITARNWGEPEDRRYQKIRARNQPHFALKSLFIVFLLQGVLAWIVALPMMAAGAAPAELTILDWIGAAIAIAGIVVETIADWQMARFKAQPASAGQVMDRGLWRYSRHPNYFGETCTWWGLWLLAVSAGGWWTVASPLLMTLLLLKVSGVVLLERDIAERRPAYARYIKQTNAFIPGPPRRESSMGG